jgi:opacity protein-like surface antigen
MRMRGGLTPSVMALLVLCVPPAQAAPGPESGFRMSSTVGASLGDGGSAAEVGGAVGYRVNRFAGFELEITYVPSLDFGGRRAAASEGVVTYCASVVPQMDPGPPAGCFVQPGIYPPVSVRTSGHALTFTTNFVGEIPSTVSWLRPYVVAGGGVGSVSERFHDGDGPGGIIPMDHGTNAAGMIGTDAGGSTTTGLALTVGGGLDIQVWKGLAIGADARYVHIARGSGGLDMTRVGGRVSWRF